MSCERVSRRGLSQRTFLAYHSHTLHCAAVIGTADSQPAAKYTKIMNRDSTDNTD